jgi:protein required for attachment to host cells
MPLPHNALVLVADGRKMLFFRNHGDENQIDLRTEAHEEREDRKDRDYHTDAPGTAAHGAGAAGRGIGAQGGGHTGRPVMEETDFHQQEEDRWIKEAADELKKRVLRNDFEALAIVAPPKALGVLKKNLHKEVEKRIVCSINKEMSGRPIPDIEALLVDKTQADLPTV